MSTVALVRVNKLYVVHLSNISDQGVHSLLTVIFPQ